MGKYQIICTKYCIDYIITIRNLTMTKVTECGRLNLQIEALNLYLKIEIK